MKLHSITALDFDGVLCDSASETAETAWQAGRQIWNDWGASAPPAELVERFRRLRPHLETGYQAVPLMRLAASNLTDEYIAESFLSLVDETIANTGLSKKEMAALFGNTRDRWIEHDLDGWLACHRFYPGTIERLQVAMHHVKVVILTTKQERFVQILLNQAGVELSTNRIYGLEDGRKKENILESFLSEANQQNSSRDIGFVEDRVETLERVIQSPSLKNVELYLADWGYNTEAMRQRARATERIHILSLGEFADKSG